MHGLTRGVATEVTFRGVTIQPGDRLMVSLVSANRDEDHFDRSQEFDPDRWLANAERQFLAGGKILPFGAGRHHCAGSRLAGDAIAPLLLPHAIRTGRAAGAAV